MRTSNDKHEDGRLIDGYDYANQAWVVDGRYVACAHPASMHCRCYGRAHAGDETGAKGRADKLAELRQRIAYGESTVFLIEVSRRPDRKSGYAVRNRVVGNPAQACVLYSGINLGNGYRKRLRLEWSKRPIARQES